jgi:hypothetical protein
MKFRNVLVAAVVGVAAMTAPALATTIDTTGTLLDDAHPFGQPNTATYGQTFTAPDSQLTNFSLFLENRDSESGGSGSLDLRGYIGTWTGTNVGSILFESTTQTMNAAGTQQEFAFSPNITLVPGDVYVAFLSISNLPLQPDDLFQMPLSDDEITGSFVYLNNGLDPSQWTSQEWSDFGGQDAWFKASFTSGEVGGGGLPEPSAWTMLLLGFAGVGFFARRSGAKPALIAA